MYPLGLSIFDDPGDTMGISTWVHSQVIHWGSNWTKKLSRLCVVFSHHIYIYNKTSGWWFGTFSIFPYIFPYIGKNDPNWLIFFRGVETTNQTWILILVQYNRLYPPKKTKRNTQKNCIIVQQKTEKGQNQRQNLRIFHGGNRRGHAIRHLLPDGAHRRHGHLHHAPRDSHRCGGLGAQRALVCAVVFWGDGEMVKYMDCIHLMRFNGILMGLNGMEWDLMGFIMG